MPTTVELPGDIEVEFPDEMDALAIHREIANSIPNLARLSPSERGVAIPEPGAPAQPEQPPVPNALTQAFRTSPDVAPVDNRVPVTDNAQTKEQMLVSGVRQEPASGPPPIQLPRAGAPGTLLHGASDIAAGIGEWALNNPEELVASLYPPTKAALALRYGPEVLSQFVSDAKKASQDGDAEALGRFSAILALVLAPGAAKGPPQKYAEFKAARNPLTRVNGAPSGKPTSAEEVPLYVEPIDISAEVTPEAPRARGRQPSEPQGPFVMPDQAPTEPPKAPLLPMAEAELQGPRARGQQPSEPQGPFLMPDQAAQVDIARQPQPQDPNAIETPTVPPASPTQPAAASQESPPAAVPQEPGQLPVEPAAKAEPVRDVNTPEPVPTTPETASKRQPSAREQRPWDLIDEIAANVGKLKGKKSGGEANPGHYPETYRESLGYGAVRALYSNQEGQSLDSALDTLRRSVALPEDFTTDDLHEALIGAAKARKAWRSRGKEAKTTVDREEAQHIDFAEHALTERAGGEPVSVSELLAGDSFKLAGEDFKVKQLHFDPETTDLAYVEVEDGRRFGVQMIGAEQVIHPDKGSLDQKAPSTDFLPKERTAEEINRDINELKAVKDPTPIQKAKLRELETELGQGDLLNVPQDKTPEAIAAEKQAAEQRRLIAERQGTHLRGESGLQGDLLNEDPQGDIFGENIPQAQRPQNKFAFDLWRADDDVMAEFFKERFGDTGSSSQPLSAGRRGTYVFPTYAEFKAWMDARFQEGDLEGLKLAFAEADTKMKVAYVKDAQRSGDPILKEWVSHIATGSVLPPTKPVVPRTTPRPLPGGRTAPTPPPRRPGSQPAPGAPAPAPGRPMPPPPPPRPTPNTPGHRKFDITALVQLFRQFEKSPTVNSRLTRAYGRFMRGVNNVELKQRLMWDEALAERILAHEIGHFLDLAVPLMGHGRMLGEKLKPLEDFTGRMHEALALRNEARNLSRSWRGPFLNGDPYRDSAAELMADFMSAMLTNPEWVNQHFGVLFDAFREFRDGKPRFATAYREVETWLQGGTLSQELRAQDAAAVNRTFDILAKDRSPTRASLMDRLKFATLSMWQRAYEHEGKPRGLGTSIAEELEYSTMWAAKENAIWSDDYRKEVQPFLEQVDKDPLAARTLLLSVSKAVRTIGERRASGLWIEQNPNEARALLRVIVGLDPLIESKYGSDVDTASNSALYDLAATVLREMHDRGEKFTARVSRKINALNLGVKGDQFLVAFNVRGKLLNPQGLTVTNAERMLAQIQHDIGPARWTALKKAAENLRDLVYGTQEKMFNEGLISKKTWNELIAPNRGNYLPYAVLDYFDGYVRAGVLPQKGTAKDIADIAVASQLKVAASNGWRQKQRQVQLLRDAWNAGGTPVPLGEVLQHASDIDRIRAQHSQDDISRAVIWSDGVAHVVEFPGDPGKLIEKALDSKSFYEHMQWVAEATNVSHKVMQFYTQFSVPFMFWRNPTRGLRTGALKVGFKAIAKQMTPAELRENARLARNYAAAAFGEKLLPEVRDLIDRQVLSPPRLSHAFVHDAENLRQLMENHGMLAYDVRHFTGLNTPKWWLGGQFGRRAIIRSEKIFAGYEAFEKIYNYRASMAQGLGADKARAIARRGGIPNPGVGGKWSLAMEVFMPWTRVHIQGLRATYDLLKDPVLGPGFTKRFIFSEALPRIAKVALGSGVIAGTIAWLLNKDEDKNDPVIGEFFRRVSPYKMALDDMMPLYFYDARTGKIHYLWEFKAGKEVPKHYEAVSWRIPASEEGRLWGTLLYNVMIQSPGADSKMGRPGQNLITAFGNWGKDYAVPGISPLLKTPTEFYDMIALGKNPLDSYRNQPSANPKLFNAGGVDRAQAIAGYALNQLGSVGEVAGILAANMGILDQRALNALSTRLPGDVKTMSDRVPFLKTFVSHDNYAQYRDEKIASLAEAQIQAKARLIMSDDFRSVYDFYYRNLKRQKAMTPSEHQQFEISKRVVQTIWGSMKKDGAFYARAAHAVGPDGSAEAKDTVKRDMDQAAAPWINAFKKARAGKP